MASIPAWGSDYFSENFHRALSIIYFIIIALGDWLVFCCLQNFFYFIKHTWPCDFSPTNTDGSTGFTCLSVAFALVLICCCVRTDGWTVTSQRKPKVLVSMSYHIFLPMVLSARPFSYYRTHVYISQLLSVYPYRRG